MSSSGMGEYVCSLMMSLLPYCSESDIPLPLQQTLSDDSISRSLSTGFQDLDKTRKLY